MPFLQGLRKQHKLMKKEQGESKMIPETITYEEAAERYKCDPRSLRRAVIAGKIEAYKPGLRILIDIKSADAWFMSTKRQPSPILGRPRKGAKR